MLHIVHCFLSQNRKICRTINFSVVEPPLNINFFCSNFFCHVFSLNGTKLGVQTVKKEEIIFFHMFMDHPSAAAAVTICANVVSIQIPDSIWPAYMNRSASWAKDWLLDRRQNTHLYSRALRTCDTQTAIATWAAAVCLSVQWRLPMQ